MSEVAEGPRVRIVDSGTVPLYTDRQNGPERDEVPSTTQYVEVVNTRNAVLEEIVEYLKALYK